MHVRSLIDPPGEHRPARAAERGAVLDGPSLAHELADFAVALRRASTAWHDAVAELVPSAPGHGSVADRIARVRAEWAGEARPSYEQLAGLLAAVDAASGALVLAARRFDAATVAAERASGTGRAR